MLFIYMINTLLSSFLPGDIVKFTKSSLLKVELLKLLPKYNTHKKFRNNRKTQKVEVHKMQRTIENIEIFLTLS